MWGVVEKGESPIVPAHEDGKRIDIVVVEGNRVPSHTISEARLPRHPHPISIRTSTHFPSISHTHVYISPNGTTTPQRHARTSTLNTQQQSINQSSPLPLPPRRPKSKESHRWSRSTSHQEAPRGVAAALAAVGLDFDRAEDDFHAAAAAAAGQSTTGTSTHPATARTGRLHP